MEDVKLDPERQQKAKEYARISRRLMVVDLILGGVYAVAWLVFGWSAALRNYLLNYTSNDWLLVAGFGMVFGGIYLLINLPLSYYSGFILPHRYGQSNETRRGWVTDQIKGGLISIAFGGILLEIIYAVLRISPNWWWLWAGLIILLFSVVLANLAPILLFPIFYKFSPLGDDHADLVDRLMRLADQAHTRVKGVYQFDMSRRTKSANAALTGLGGTRRIILGDTLINDFSTDEIETVLAHELGHHVNKDIPMGIIISTILTLGGLFLANLALRWGVNYFHFNGISDIAALPLFMLVMGGYGLITMPLNNAYSRWRERRADEYALKTTQKADAFATAMTRLANQNLAEVDPEPWVEYLLYSHPALNRRIAMAESYARPTKDLSESI